MRSRPCCAPAVTRMFSLRAGVPSAAMTSTITSRILSRPAVGPYWRAWALSAATAPQISWNASSPNVLVSGKPPASEIMPGCERVDIRSRVAALFMPFIRPAYRELKRSGSGVGVRFISSSRCKELSVSLIAVPFAPALASSRYLLGLLLQLVGLAGDPAVPLLLVVGVLLKSGSAAAEARRREGLQLGSVYVT